MTGTGEDLFVSAAPLPHQYWPTATGLTLLGITGIGKTVAVEAWMKLYPQRYVHTEYWGRAFTHTLVTYLRLQGPRNGSLHDLIENFFQSMDAPHYSVPIDTGYRDAYKKGRRTIQELIPDMARLASQHGLGLLILDEVQDLAPRGAPAILSFLVQLVNTIGVPIVLVGGLEALPLLTEQFRQARRGQTEGDMIIGQAEEGRDFRAFCERMWEFQYTLERTPLTDAIVGALHDGSQGITQYVVLLHKLSQERAITLGQPHVTPGPIRSVARDSLNLSRPVINTIRAGNKEFLRRIPDVELLDGYEAVPFLRGDPGARKRKKEPAPAETEAANAAPPRRAAAKPGAKAPAVRSTAAIAAEAAPAIEHGEPLPDVIRSAVTRGEDPSEVLVDLGLAGDRLWDRVVGPDAVAALRGLT